MKKMYRNIDTETVFYDDEIEKAQEYFEISGDFETLEELAEEWNRIHAWDGIGEMIVKEV